MTEPVIYLALGDSLTAGYGAPPGHGFADLYRILAAAQLQKPIRLVNKGMNGARAAEVLKRVKSDDNLQQEMKNASIITITAGGNDMLDAARQFLNHRDTKNILRTIRACRRTLQELFHFIQRNKKGATAPYQIIIANLYNPFPQFKEAEFGVTMFNRMVESFSSSKVCVADIYRSFSGMEHHLLSEDLIHPNYIGYQVMAKQFAACGYPS